VLAFSVMGSTVRKKIGAMIAVRITWKNPVAIYSFEFCPCNRGFLALSPAEMYSNL